MRLLGFVRVCVCVCACLVVGGGVELLGEGSWLKFEKDD